MTNSYIRAIILWIWFLPVLTSGISIKSPLNQDEPSENSSINCEFFDATCVRDAKEKGSDFTTCVGIKQCKINEICHVTWKNYQPMDKNNQTFSKTNFPHKSGKDVKLMGCMENQMPQCKSNTCLDKRSLESRQDAGHKVFHCCCNTDLCNANFSAMMHKPEEPKKPHIKPEPKKEDNFTLYVGIIVGFVIILAIVVISIIGYKVKKENKLDNQEPTDQTQVQSYTGMNQEHQNDAVIGVDLEQIPIGTGKFGNVLKAKKNTEVFAVKTFTFSHKKSWKDECKIYKLPHMDQNSNILKFLFESYNIKYNEYWLATELQDGCLYSHLKEKILKWDEMCKIALSMMEGLTFLHEEYKPAGSELKKPSIAHRDFKSKNVLIKRDMTACIADFGLAITLDNFGDPDTHNKVGTVRYMSPELLEGAVNFSRDTFMRIDMYACALVLWEILSRCKIAEDDFQVFDFKLPFQAEEEQAQITMPNNLPTIQEWVVSKKIRPKIQDSWRSYHKAKKLCDTIEECWDHDAEARLSASCAVEKIKDLMNASGNQQNLTENESDAIDRNGDTSSNSNTKNTNRDDEIPMSDLSIHPA